MFYVEQPMKCIILALFLMFITSCDKKDPHPEAKDEIYNDLMAELEIASKAADSEEKSLNGFKAEIGKAVPQTGQIKYATKRLRASEDSLNELKQRRLYFEIKAERRKAYVEQRYHESFNKDGRPWPDQQEIEVYKSITKFNREKLEWDKNKGIKKGVPRGTKVEKKEEGE